MICIHINATRQELGNLSARMVGERIRKIHCEKEFVNIVFAAAPSQNEFLAALKKEQLDWSRVRAFQMDEYVGLPGGSDKSFSFYLKNNLSNLLPGLNTFYMNDQIRDPAGECQRYSELLEEFPTDITCMGIGENNHIAFNDPEVADFRDPEKVKKVDLDLTSRQQQVNDACFSNLDEVPRQAITITIPRLVQSPFIFCMVPGKRKANAVLKTITGQVSESHPSTILQKGGQVELFLDKESSQLL